MEAVLISYNYSTGADEVRYFRFIAEKSNDIRASGFDIISKTATPLEFNSNLIGADEVDLAVKHHDSPSASNKYSFLLGQST